MDGVKAPQIVQIKKISNIFIFNGVQYLLNFIFNYSNGFI